MEEQDRKETNDGYGLMQVQSLNIHEIRRALPFYSFISRARDILLLLTCSRRGEDIWGLALSLCMSSLTLRSPRGGRGGRRQVSRV